MSENCVRCQTQPATTETKFPIHSAYDAIPERYVQKGRSRNFVLPTCQPCKDALPSKFPGKVVRWLADFSKSFYDYSIT